MNESLSEALTSTETVAEVPAPAASSEQTESATTDQSAIVEPADSSLTTTESAEAKTEPTEQAKTEQIEPTAIVKMREWGEGLEKDLNTLRSTLDGFGGESTLNRIKGAVELANAIPQSEEEFDLWGKQALDVLGQLAVDPRAIDAMKSQAAWGYLNNPASQRVITESIYGEGVTPEVLAEFARAYRENPEVLTWFRPEETAEQKTQREAYEARERERDTQLKAITERDEKREAERIQGLTQQTISQVLGVGSFTPRAEVKKQYGLEYQKQAGDSPIVAQVSEHVAKLYDRLSILELGQDSEAQMLFQRAHYLSGQKDDAHRQRALDQVAPELQRRSNAVCARVAKELAEYKRMILDPQGSDRAKAENLKDLPAQVLGSTAGVSTNTGFDLSGMPDPSIDPRGYETWVARKTAEYNQSRRAPAILQAG